MRDEGRIRALIEFLLRARARNSALMIEPPLFLESSDEAYAVQDAVLRALDPRPPRAWKVSPPRDGASYGTPIPARGVKTSPAELPGATRLLGVEAEVAFRFARAPSLEGGRDDVMKAIEEAFVLLELCETRFANWEEVPALTRVADFQSHGGFVLGSGTRDWHDIDFPRQAVNFDVNGQSVVSNVGSHPTGDPFALVEWGVTHCAARGMRIAAGDVITTGTWIGLQPVDPGDEVVARFEGIGEATLRIASR